MEVIDLHHALQTYIVGQQRTGRNKQFVFFCNDEEVVKGPYKKDRVDTIQYRDTQFSKWDTPHVVKPIRCAKQNDGTRYIYYPNIMSGYNMESKWHTEKFGDNLSYRILERNEVDKMNKVIMDNPWIYDHGYSLVLALCHLYILKTGDVGMANILVDTNKRQIYIIDYDEHRSTDNDNSMFYFTKPAAAKYKWYENVRVHYHAVADKLTELLEQSPEHRERIEMTIQLLRKYATDETLTKLDTKKIVKIPVNRVTTPRPTVKPTLKLTTIGQMHWKGLRGPSKTYHGHALDVMKSALQKYVRRGVVDKALMCAFELYRFSEIPEAKAAITNLYNRLAIIANEDVGPADLPLAIYVTSMVNNKNRDPEVLARMVQLLAESKKTRIMSHVWHAYGKPENIGAAADMGISVDQEFRSDDLEYIQANTADGNLFKASDPEVIRPYVVTYFKRLYEGDYNAFTWLYYYLEASKDLKVSMRSKGTVGRTSKPMILLWETLRYFLHSDVVNPLVTAYFNTSENRPFIATATIAALHRVQYNALNPGRYDGAISLDDLVSNNYHLELDGYVYDKHTKEGRKRGADIKLFVTEGAHVENEDPTYINEPLQRLYTSRDE